MMSKLKIVGHLIGIGTIWCCALLNACNASNIHKVLYVYSLDGGRTSAAYDEAVVVACFQELLNKEEPQLYLLSDAYERPRYWLDTLASTGKWLEKRDIVVLHTLGELAKLTVAHQCFNQTVLAQAPVGDLKQGRPELKEPEAGKTYLCILMADYDSATPLYDFLPKHWDDSARGDIPLAWGINPNLIESYPDVIQHFYDTKSPNDFFTADASAAGYMNPNRIDSAYMPLFVNHNKHFYDRLDMSLSPMVLDWDEPTDAVKDAFTQFSSDGFSTIVIDFHNKGGKAPASHVWKGMPVMELINSACNFSTPPSNCKGNGRGNIFSSKW